MKSLSCPNPYCRRLGKGDAEPFLRHGFYTTGWGKRRRSRQAGQSIIDSNTAIPHMMKLPLSVSSDLKRLPSIESGESPGIPSIAGWKKQPAGVIASATAN